MITFDPANKIIQLDSFAASAQEIWTAMVDWAAQGDNLKYGVGMLQIGGVPPVALYLYLTAGWRVRPLEADGTTTISGNLLVDPNDGGGDPIVPTLGNYQVLVNMETPVQAVAVETGTSGLTQEESDQLAKIDELKAEHETLNAGLKKASISVPHTDDLPPGAP